MINEDTLARFVRSLVRDVREGKYLDFSGGGSTSSTFQRSVGEMQAPPDLTEEYVKRVVAELRALLEHGG